MDKNFKEIIKKEYVRCVEDPVYFLKKYSYIQHPIEGKIPFNLYDFQEDLIEDFQNYRFNIVLKGRQLGISTASAAYVAWLLLFHRNKNVVVMATKLDTAGNLVKKVKLAMKSLPEWMMISKITLRMLN